MNSDVPKMPVFLKFSAFVHFLPLKSHLHALEVPQYLVSEKVVPKKTFDQSQQLKKKTQKTDTFGAYQQTFWSFLRCQGFNVA